MDEYQFINCTPELEIKDSKNLLFFFLPDFVIRNGCDNLICYAIKKGEKLVAYIYFEIIDNKAISLPQSPFGGIVIMDKIDTNLIGEFVAFIMATLKNLKIKEIEIRLSPDCYGIMSLENTFRKQGFKKLYSEVNQHLEIGKESFHSKLNADKRYRLNSCYKASFKSRLLKDDELHDAYLIIEENLAKKGFPLTLNWDNIEISLHLFPDKYIAFGTIDKGKLIATTMVVKVSQNILYNFYHGYHEEYSKYSPLIATINSEYEYAATHGYKIIDMGISSVKGELNTGLFHFKNAIGGIKSAKSSYRYTYD